MSTEQTPENHPLHIRAGDMIGVQHSPEPTKLPAVPRWMVPLGQAPGDRPAPLPGAALIVRLAESETEAGLHERLRAALPWLAQFSQHDQRACIEDIIAAARADEAVQGADQLPVALTSWQETAIGQRLAVPADQLQWLDDPAPDQNRPEAASAQPETGSADGLERLRSELLQMTRERNAAIGEKGRLELKADPQRRVTGAMVAAASDAIADGLGVPRYEWHKPQRREAVRAGLVNALGMEALSATEKEDRR